jgi:hypothetical protein
LITARYFSSDSSDSGSLRTPCHPPACAAGQQGITPAFGYSAPHPSAGGTLTLLTHTLPSTHYAGSDSSPGRTPRQGLSACFVLPSEHPDPNHVVGPDITISSTSVCPAGCRHPDFALGPRARRTKTPKRVRYPTGCSFASGCSPPRLPRSRSRTTQLPSATCGVTSHGSDLHLLTKQHHRRTVLAFARTTVRVNAIDLPDAHDLRIAVNPLARKYFCFPEYGTSVWFAHPASHAEGRIAIVTRRGAGMRWT